MPKPEFVFTSPRALEIFSPVGLELRIVFNQNKVLEFDYRDPAVREEDIIGVEDSCPGRPPARPP
jgi:hypothetical protein